IPGVYQMLMTPSTDMHRKYSIMIGPNIAATRLVPPRWMENRRTRMITARGTMTGSSPGFTTARPSIADSTETHGVNKLSPQKRDRKTRRKGKREKDRKEQ